MNKWNDGKWFAGKRNDLCKKKTTQPTKETSRKEKKFTHIHSAHMEKGMKITQKSYFEAIM